MDLHNALLLWKNDAETHLRVSEVSSADPNVIEGAFVLGEGIFGAVTTSPSSSPMSHDPPASSAALERSTAR
jgi:hypothetical protein